MFNKRKADELIKKLEGGDYFGTRDDIDNLQNFARNIFAFKGDTYYIEKCHELGFPVEEKEQDPYLNFVNDLPPHVQTVAKLFCETFSIPNSIIPTQKEKSRFSEWIREFEYLSKIGGKHFRNALSMSKKTHENLRFPISRPASINTIFMGALQLIESADTQISTPISEGRSKDVASIEDFLSIGDIFK